jgi:F-type H+-transporting ATPase subunit a
MRNRLLTILGAVFVVGLVLYLLGFRMTRADLHISARAEPLWCIGGVVEGEACSAGTLIPFTNSLLMTIIVDLTLLGLIIAGVGRMQLVPRGLQNMLEAVVEGVYNFARGIDRQNVAKFFPLPMTIFLFFLIANMLALVPLVGSIGICETVTHAATTEATTAAAPAQSLFTNWPGHCSGTDAQGNELLLIPLLRAPAADLNVTFAFALVSMFMVEFFGFQALGLTYLTKFFNFKEGPMGTFVGLIELISEVSRIISFAFRIFGNIFGGEVIIVVMAYLFPYLLPLPFYGFEVFVALMQAIIFAILTLIFCSTAIIAHGHDDHGEHEEVQVESDVAAHHA